MWKWIMHVEVYILYRQISTYWIKQSVNSTQHYVSIKPVWRFLSQELYSWNKVILIYIPSFWKLSYRKLCIRALVVLTTTSCCPFSANFTQLDQYKTQHTASLAWYLLYCLFKWVIFAPDGICGVQNFWLYWSLAIKVGSTQVVKLNGKL